MTEQTKTKQEEIRKTAIKECKELWAEIEAHGGDKEKFFKSPEGERWSGIYFLNCPLCEYTRADLRLCFCPHCPLLTQFGRNCYELGFKDSGKCPKRWFNYIRKLEG